MENETKAITERKNLSKDIVESILFKGDISGLTQEQKLQYYLAICERQGLDPTMQPFQVIKFPANNKEVLYCTKAGAEQLNKQNSVSHEIKKKEITQDTYTVEVRASLPDGRYVDDVGIVSLKTKNYKTGTEADATGDILVNLMLKAVTKAKRRATLSLLGLGMLDETETETILGAKTEPINITPIGDTSPRKEKVPTEKIVMQKSSSVGGGGATSKCSNCGKEISQRVYDYSIEKQGKALCYNCQHPEEVQEEDKEEQQTFEVNEVELS